MKQYSSYKRHNQWQEARKLLEDAAECGYLPAKIELAHLYKNTLELHLPQAVRYHKAAQIYLGLLDFANLSSCTSERVMLELADLYGIVYSGRGVENLLSQNQADGYSRFWK